MLEVCVVSDEILYILLEWRQFIDVLMCFMETEVHLEFTNNMVGGR